MDLYQWIMILIAMISTVIATIKILWGRIETNLNNNFQVMQNRLEDVAKQSAQNHDDIRDLERKFYKFQIDLPHVYVAREDYIRGQTVIEAKLDALALKIASKNVPAKLLNKEVYLRTWMDTLMKRWTPRTRKMDTLAEICKKLKAQN